MLVQWGLSGTSAHRMVATSDVASQRKRDQARGWRTPRWAAHSQVESGDNFNYLTLQSKHMALTGGFLRKKI